MFTPQCFLRLLSFALLGLVAGYFLSNYVLSGRQDAAIAEHAEAVYRSPSSFVAGNPQGDVSVVVFFDYNCPYCRAGAPELAKLVANDGKARLVLKELPVLGPDSEAVARVAQAVFRLTGDSIEAGSLRARYERELAAAINDLPPALPPHTEATMVLADEMSKPPTAKNILDAFSVLAGVYGPRGDPEIIASVGVELVQAERPSRMALYAATVALLRPVSGESPSSANGWNDVPDTPRKFAPTLSEFITELRKHQRRWQFLTSEVQALPARYATIQKGLQALMAASRHESHSVEPPGHLDYTRSSKNTGI
jgi:thiol-disulfide isomerase/thioredoxin